MIGGNLWRKLQVFVHPSSRLSQRVVTSGFWAISIRVGERLLSVARVVVLARLLAPQDFGILGIAMLVMEFLEAFTRTGFGAALVQRKGDIRSYLDTSWTVQIFRGVVQAGVMFLGASYIATFFDAPNAVLVIRVLAGASLIKGFLNVGIVYFQKDLQLHKQFVYQIGTAISAIVVAVPLALILRNVWALVFGVLAGEFVALLLSYVIHPYRPRFNLNFQKAKQLYSFGRWIFLSALISYTASQLDRIVVGKLIGTMFLGLYQMGRTLSNTATKEVGAAVSLVAFPVYAELQDNVQKLRQAFLRTWETTACIALPIAVILFFLADSAVKLILGPQWLPAVPVVKILAISGFFLSLIGGGGAIFKGIGRPRLEMQLNLLRIVITIALFYPLAKLWGMSGIALAVLFAMLATMPLLLRYVISILNIGLKDLLRASSSALGLGLTMGVVTLLIKLGFNIGTLQGFAGIIAINLLIYAGVSCALWWRFRSGPIRVIAAFRGS